MNHRALQRTLFRMQHDARFARAVRDGDPDALRSTGLAVEESDILRKTDPRTLSADRDGGRSEQFLRNVASEFALSVALHPRVVEGFAESPEFHQAVCDDGPFPLALGRLLQRVEPACVIVRLESELARIRRTTGTASPEIPPGFILRAPDATLLVLPAGTWVASVGIHEALATGSEIPPLEVDPLASETLVVLRRPRENAFALPELHVERVSAPVAQFLREAERPLSLQDCVRIARRNEATLAELEPLLHEFETEGILVRGS